MTLPSSFDFSHPLKSWKATEKPLPFPPLSLCTVYTNWLLLSIRAVLTLQAFFGFFAIGTSSTILMQTFLFLDPFRNGNIQPHNWVSYANFLKEASLTFLIGQTHLFPYFLLTFSLSFPQQWIDFSIKSSEKFKPSVLHRVTFSTFSPLLSSMISPFSFLQWFLSSVISLKMGISEVVGEMSWTGKLCFFLSQVDKNSQFFELFPIGLIFKKAFIFVATSWNFPSFSYFIFILCLNFPFLFQLH